MTATDELRRLLDERGVKWMPSAWSAKDETFYKVGDVGYLATELSSGKMKVCIEGYPTTEQAIAATLGAGVCRLKPWEMERDTGYYDCMQCGCGYVADVGDWAEWHFCPICGRRIEVDE